MKENEIGTQIIESAITVQRELGPGLLETVYEIIAEWMKTGITRCANGLEE